MEKLLVKRLCPEAVLPVRGSEHAAGFDLSAAEATSVPAGGKAIVKTGLSIAIPPCTYARIAPRSGLAAKKYINCGAGVVDYDYRGAVGVVLFNHSSEAFDVAAGDRIAQLILERISMAACEEVETLDSTTRGSGGFGSTGVSREPEAPVPMEVGQASARLGIEKMQVKKLRPEAVLPVRGSADAAGFDLAAAEASTIPAGGKGLVKTGLSIAIPSGTYARIAPRSGLAAKRMIHVGAGVVDYDYRGEVGVVLFNHGAEAFDVAVGDRIAQMLLEEISMAHCQEVDVLSDTERGVGGFGSTGVAETVGQTTTPSKRAKSDVVSSTPVASPGDEVAALRAELAVMRAQLNTLAAKQ